MRTIERNFQVPQQKQTRGEYASATECYIFFLLFGRHEEFSDAAPGDPRIPL